MTNSPPAKVNLSPDEPARVLASGIDSQYLALDVRWADGTMFERLAELKARAKAAGDDEPTELVLADGSAPWRFNVKPHGVQGYEWILDGKELDLRIGQWLEPKSRPSIMANLRSETLWMHGPKTADSLGLYGKADDLTTERAQVESALAALGTAPTIAPPDDLRARIAAEFDRMETVMASGTLEERRALIGCYLHSIKADPDSQEVRIGLYPVVLSQIIVMAGLWSGLHICAEQLHQRTNASGKPTRPGSGDIAGLFGLCLVSPSLSWRVSRARSRRLSAIRIKAGLRNSPAGVQFKV